MKLFKNSRDLFFEIDDRIIKDGKLRFNEKWKWSTGQEGTSVIEEL